MRETTHESLVAVHTHTHTHTGLSRKRCGQLKWQEKYKLQSNIKINKNTLLKLGEFLLVYKNNKMEIL